MIYSLVAPQFANAEKYNAVFLRDKTGNADLQPFKVQNDLIPGTYRVDIFMNSRRASSEEITFVERRTRSEPEVKPEITLALLQRLGADVTRLKEEGFIAQEAKPTTLVTLEAIPGVSVDFDPGTLVLNINFPQAYVRSRSQGYVDPSLWDDGVAAAFTNYQLNLSRNQQEAFRSDYLYLNLRNGLNLGAWHLRNDSALSQSNGSDRHYSSNRSWITRDLTALKSSASLGQLFTGGTIFDSVRLRGATLSSDTGMLPADQIGYAPVVRGIAETRATVEVRQNGYVIYSTTVPAGAFAIRDIFPGGSNGDLEITVIEADGRTRKYTQAYSYLPIMTRRGNLQYAVAVGKYDNDPAQSPALMQAELVYGLTDNVTSFGGMQTSKRYLALNAGLGVNSPLGGGVG
ncbi:fimbria/pilus outer membrane usher protein [Enterobacter hormaechei]